MLGGPGGRDGLLAAAAKYLGVTPTQLGSQLESGRSLAQVARELPGWHVRSRLCRYLGHAEYANDDQCRGHGDRDGVRGQRRLPNMGCRRL